MSAVSTRLVSQAQAGGQYSPGCKHGVVLNVSWTYSSKTGEFLCRSTVTVTVCRVSSVSRLRVSVRIRLKFSFGDRVGIRLPDVE